MIRPYEALYIIHPDLSEEDVTSTMEKYKEVVETEGGEVESVNRWEKRRLAYEIKGQKEGIYVLMNYKAEAKVSTELDRLLKITENVLRHIIVRLDEK